MYLKSILFFHLLCLCGSFNFSISKKILKRLFKYAWGCWASREPKVLTLISQREQACRQAPLQLPAAKPISSPFLPSLLLQWKKVVLLPSKDQASTCFKWWLASSSPLELPPLPLHWPLCVNISTSLPVSHTKSPSLPSQLLQTPILPLYLLIY